MAKKEVIYQGLAELPVLINDTSATSPNYFRVNTLPTVLTAGTNFIQFKGNASLFSENSEVYIEVIDSNGSPVYYETDVNVDNGEPTAIISVYINQDTAPGTAYVVLVSTAKKDINGMPLDSSKPNVRWIGQTYIDVQKANNAEIIFDQLPTISVYNYTGSYVNYTYTSGTSKITTTNITGLSYYYYNNTAILTTSSISSNVFDSTALNATVRIAYSDLSNATPIGKNIDTSYTYTSSVNLISGSGQLNLTNPLVFNILNSNSKYIPKSATVNAQITYEQSASVGTTTENSHNLAVVYFGNLQPLTGTISKIKSYYKSSGVGEYIFVNETDISEQASEFGFTANSVTASFFMPTVHRNDRLDFKFEFVNPYGVISKQYVESLNNLFLGGNTYIGGSDNLLTGSLFVAGATGTGVEITGKGDASVVKSIGYQGLQKATAGTAPAGFVLYSGSIQSVIGSTEVYEGVGLDLVANTSSYLRYTTANGGILEVRTDRFFIGNNNVFLSGSNNNLEILVRDPVPPLTKFHLRPSGEVTASAFMAFTGSSDTTIYRQLDTKIGLVDGKNIARVLLSKERQNDGNIYPGGVSTSALGASYKYSGTNGVIYALNNNVLWNASGNFISWDGTSNYYGSTLLLPFETRIALIGYLMVGKVAGAASTNHPLSFYIQFGIRDLTTGSGAPTTNGEWAGFGTPTSDGNPLGYGTENVYLAAVSGAIDINGFTTGSTNYTLPSAYTTSNIVKLVPFRLDLNVPESLSNRLVSIGASVGYVVFTNASYGTTDFTFKWQLANVMVVAGRSLSTAAVSGNGSSNGYIPNPGGYTPGGDSPPAS